MYALAIDVNEVLHYWTGGEVFSEDPKEAVTFGNKVDVDRTIDVLRRALPNLSPTAHAELFLT
jgi:hypothetical protein